MKNVAFIYEEKGEYAPRDGYEFVKRDNVAAIIKYKDEYLLLKFNEVNYSKSLVTGGIEKDENMIEATKREVIEETGYLDIDSVTPINCVNISKFFVEHKGQNREATYYPFLVEINSNRKVDIADKKKKEHSCIWVKSTDLDKIDIFDNHRKMLDASRN